MISTFQRTVSSTGAALRRRYLEQFLEPAALKRALKRAQPGRIALDLPAQESGAYEQGRDFIAGIFDFGGGHVEIPLTQLWSKPAPTNAWRSALHSFDWLEDLAAVGDAAAQKAAQTTTLQWIEHHGGYDPLIWRVALSARRLRNWLLNAQMLQSGLSNAAIDKFRLTAWAHADWIFRGISSIPMGLDRLYSAVTLVTASIAIDGLAAERQVAFQNLDRALIECLRKDGSMIGRSPQDSFEALRMLRLLSEQLTILGVDIPERVLAAERSLGRVVRFFRAGDGGLPCFHGASECANGQVEAVLARMRGLPSPPKSLPDAGYERIVAGRASVIVDAGRAEDDSCATRAHASALAIETFAARRRLIVNCGSAASLEPAKRVVFRGEAAHSTLIVDNAPFAERRADGDERAIAGPPNISVERKEERNGVWLLCAHDGYVARYGLTASRRLYLSADGGDFRGVDSLSVESDADTQAMARAIQSLPRARRDHGIPFVARFHLHPDVSVTMVADGEAATLRLPHGEVWVMRQAGGSLGLEDSVYLGRSFRPEHTRQLVIRGAARRSLTQLRWAFRRVGELAQLPKDLSALGVAYGDDDFEIA